MLKKFLLVVINFLIISAAFAQGNSCILQKVQHCDASLTPTICLFKLIHQRECLMQAVAANKYLYQGAIYDATQERIILLNVEKSAKNFHLNVSKLQIFAQIQMDVSKQIETYWIQCWRSKHLTPTSLISLNNLRQSIELLDRQILVALIKALPTLHNPSEYEQLSQQLAKELNIPGVPKNPNYQLILLNALIQIE